MMTLYTIFQEIISQLSSLYWPHVDPIIGAAGLEVPRGTFVILNAFNMQPDPISVDEIMDRQPYGVPEPWASLLAKLTEQGYFTVEGANIMLHNRHIN